MIVARLRATAEASRSCGCGWPREKRELKGDRRRSVKRAKARTPGSVDGGATSLIYSDH